MSRGRRRCAKGRHPKRCLSTSGAGLFRPPPQEGRCGLVRNRPHHLRWKTRRGAITPSTVQDYRTGTEGTRHRWRTASEEVRTSWWSSETWRRACLLPSDEAGIVALLAKNACDESGYRRFLFITKKEGTKVAAAARHTALQENQDVNYSELQEAFRRAWNVSNN